MSTHCPKCNTENPPESKFCYSCGFLLDSIDIIPVSQTKTIETPIEELTTGSTFAGRYQIIEELGKGGMGRVYKALDKEINEKIAIKLIKPEIASDKKTIERFRNELTTARKIVQKNVCRMYDLNKDKGNYYIAMEYVSGGDLKRLIRRVGQLPTGKAISIAKQICDGLEEAHSLGIVHRDLKPNNIMIDDNGNARIMDFGIARSIKGKGITGSGVMIGTPEYMSPEQAEAKEVDQRTDIYSLGVILYEMVTGRLPFEGETPLAVAMKHKGEIPRDPKEINAQIPDDLSGIILKCLEKDKDSRYQSADSLRSELINIEKGLPTTDRDVPQKKPLTSREFTVQFNLKKLLIPAFAVIAIAVFALFIWNPWAKKESIPVSSDNLSLAVVYFTNNTGDNNLDHWRSALPQWLITDLAQSKFIRVLSGDQLLNVLRKLNLVEARSYDREDLINMARESSVNHILQASLLKAGDLFRIDYTLQNMSTGETIGTDYVSGQGEEGFPAMVDELTKKVKENLKLSAEQIAGDIDKQIGKITTGSPEAHKLYMEAWKFYMGSEYQKAIELLKTAIDLDPEFATAYRSMSGAYSNLGYAFERRKYLKKAMELSERVSDREFYRTQADFYRLSEKTYDIAIEAYEKLLELYPEDLGGNNGLGIMYRNLEEWDKAIEQYEIPIQKRSSSLFPYGNQATAYKAKGLYAKAREVLEKYIDNYSDRATLRLNMANSYICQREYDLAMAELDKAFTLDPTAYRIINYRGTINLYKGDLKRAENEFRKLLEPREPVARLTGRIELWSLYMLEGRFEEAINESELGIALSLKFVQKQWNSNCHHALAYVYRLLNKTDEALVEWERAIEIAVEIENMNIQRRLLHGKGMTYIDMGLMDLAEQIAAELKNLTEEGMNTKHRRYHFHLMGKIELKKGNISSAIDYFEKAVSLLPHEYDPWHSQALFYDSLAFAYLQARNFQKARENYEKIPSMTMGRSFCNDLYAKSFYMLGKIHEELGNKSKAIEHYEKFLDLWKDADPGLPEVDDARKRLKDLSIH